VFQNGKEVCKSDAIYGVSAASQNQKDKNSEQWESITSYQECKEPVSIKKGDKMYLVAEYDATKHRL
jgi:hypothetical protein